MATIKYPTTPAILPETIDAVLNEAGKFANENLAPLYHSGDKNPPKLREGKSIFIFIFKNKLL